MATTAAAPSVSYAAIDSLNGLTDTAQQLVSPGSTATNTMHMEIVQVGTDKHRFRWDGSPWRVDQGGTGTNFFTPGALLVGNGANPIGITYSAILNQITSSQGSELNLLSGVRTVNFVPNIRITASNSISEGVDAGGVFITGRDGAENLIGGGGAIQLQAGTGKAIEGSSPGALLELEGGLENGEGGNLQIHSGGGAGVNKAGDVNISVRKSGKIRFFTDAVATTTVEFLSSGSGTCFNTTNTDGDAISFYFVGTTMVVENNTCVE